MNRFEREKRGEEPSDEWLGERRTVDRKRLPNGSSEVMRRLMKALEVQVPGWKTQAIFSRWEEIVGGGERARTSHPEELSPDGTLWIRADQYAVRTELQFAAREIIERANRVAGGGVVRRIAFKL